MEGITAAFPVDDPMDIRVAPARTIGVDAAHILKGGFIPNGVDAGDGGGGAGADGDARKSLHRSVANIKSDRSLGKIEIDPSFAGETSFFGLIILDGLFGGDGGGGVTLDSREKLVRNTSAISNGFAALTFGDSDDLAVVDLDNFCVAISARERADYFIVNDIRESLLVVGDIERAGGEGGGGRYNSSKVGLSESIVSFSAEIDGVFLFEEVVEDLGGCFGILFEDLVGGGAELEGERARGGEISELVERGE